MRYMVTAEVTISLHTEVEANSPEEARELAYEQSVMTLCHQCARGERTKEWVTSGELDGEPTITGVEEA